MYKILVFAQLREQLGQPQVDIELPQAEVTLIDLSSYLLACFPEQRAVLEASRFAVNQVYVSDLSHPVSPNDEIALIPPVSGG